MIKGASLVGINCTSVGHLAPFLEALQNSGLPFGISANAGSPQDGLGWTSEEEKAAQAYCEHAQTWLEAGAQVIGSCCGTSPEHTRALRTLIDRGD